MKTRNVSRHDKCLLRGKIVPCYIENKCFMQNNVFSDWMLLPGSDRGSIVVGNSWDDQQFYVRRRVMFVAISAQMQRRWGWSLMVDSILQVLHPGFPKCVALFIESGIVVSLLAASAKGITFLLSISLKLHRSSLTLSSKSFQLLPTSWALSHFQSHSPIF